LRITGGIIPPTNHGGLFGRGVTYNLGGLFRLAARRRGPAEVLKTSPRSRNALAASTRFSAQRAQAQRAVRSRRICFEVRLRAAAADTPAIAHVHDALTRTLCIGVERAYLLASIEALSMFIEKSMPVGKTSKDSGKHRSGHPRQRRLQ
jgi:hypothetical protein